MQRTWRRFNEMLEKNHKSVSLTFALSYLIATLMLGWVSYTYPADRCTAYVQDVRVQNFKYFGLDFPYWYAVGQLKAESECRADAIAFDGGQGLAQFMPATERDVERILGQLDMFNPKHAINANAYYMHNLHKQNWNGALWLTYQAYNGGWKILKREFAKAGSDQYACMYLVCDRRVLTLKNGQKLDLCDVNYDYSLRVYEYGQRYSLGQDNWRYW